MKENYWNYRILNNENGYFLAECHFEEGKYDTVTKYTEVSGFSGFETYDECANAVFMAFQDILKGRYVEFTTFIK